MVLCTIRFSFKNVHFDFACFSKRIRSVKTASQVAIEHDLKHARDSRAAFVTFFHGLANSPRHLGFRVKMQLKN